VAARSARLGHLHRPHPAHRRPVQWHGGLSITVPIAALTAATIGIPQAAGHITPGILAAAAGLALLLPVLPFALEMLALRRMTSTAFGTLMALEPAIGVVLGLLVLHQAPAAIHIIGITLVVFAGAAAQRRGLRDPETEDVTDLEPELLTSL
jgi:inner membrane transporter RhtA